MADISNVKVGVCSVTFGGTDLGHTKGGVEVTYEPVHKDVMVDKFGETIVEKYLIGEKLTAKVPLAEYTIANLRRSMPQATFAGAANARITLGASAGQRASTDALQLVLHPINEGTRAFDIVFHKAYVASEIVLNHKIDEEKVIEVVFEALLDESKSDGNYLGLIGDSTA
ncbi:MAG TPA: hypothetical protein VD999_05790 [Vitreimonas sp.]|nr:hypothetical protein [Vitreimonas sp.]